jgi:hypothetical protein
MASAWTEPIVEPASDAALAKAPVKAGGAFIERDAV